MTPFEFTSAHDLRQHYKTLKSRTAYFRVSQIKPRADRAEVKTVIIPPRQKAQASPVVVSPMTQVLSVRPTYTTEVQPEENGHYSLAAIVAAAAMADNVAIHEIKSCRRMHYILPSRFVACYLARKHTKHGLPSIGRFIGKDHSTVLYAIRKVEAALKAGDERFQLLVGKATEILEAAQ